MKHIIDNIYLSNLQDALNVELIQKNKIKIVVRLSEDCIHPESEYYENMEPPITDIEYHNYELEDNCLYTKEIIQYAKIIYQLIEKNSTKHILIHCNEGQSRSVSVIIYYLMTKYNYSFDDALKCIKNIKSDADPNYGLQRALRNFDNSKSDVSLD